MLRVLLVASVAALLGISTPATLRAADPNYGLGGSSSFPAGTVFTVAPGETQPPVQSITVQNTGNRTADVAFTAKSPEGIRIQPQRDSVVLRPFEQQQIPFAIAVDSSVPGGTYDVLVEAKQTNVPKPDKGETYFVPAFGVQFAVTVMGESADVTVRALDTNTGQPVRGTLTIGMAVREGSPITVRRDESTELRTRIAPGNYVAGFEIPGLNNVSQPFEIRAGETKAIDLQVTTVSFLVADAKEKTDGSNLLSVDLVASVANKVGKIKGPIRAEVHVERDGVQLENVLLQQLPLLPPEISEFRQNYSPPDGWQPGLYTFRFVLVAPEFTVAAADIPTVEVSGSRILLCVGLLLLLVVVGVAWWILRRRKQAQEAPAFAAMPPPRGRRY